MYFSTDPGSVRPLFYTITNFKENCNTIVCSSLLSGLTNFYTNFNKECLPLRCKGGVCYEYDFMSNQLTTNSFYNWKLEQFKINTDESIKSIQNGLIDVLYKSIEKRLMSDRPIGCLLSGGLDSSIICAVVSRYLAKKGEKCYTFTIGREDSPDVIYAKKVAEYIGSIHTVVPFDNEIGCSVIDDVIKTTGTWDITSIRASVGQYLVCKYIAENHIDIPVLLVGEASDEQAAGYTYSYNAPSDEELHEDTVRLLQNIFYFDGLRVDRCVSRWGLEARLPYLDKDVVSYYLQVPGSLKRPIKEGPNKRCEKWLLRSAIDTFDPDLLPKDVLWRTKYTFSDNLTTDTNDFYKAIREYVEQKALQQCLDTKTINYCPPQTLEAKYYRYKFVEYFGENAISTIPYYWMPKWVEQTNDPSAKAMKIFQEISSKNK